MQTFGGIGGFRVVFGQFQDICPVDVAIQSKQGVGADRIEIDTQFNRPLKNPVNFMHMV